MTLLKVCGATTAADVDLLAGAGADLVGLWHGVPNGPAELPVDAVAALAERARARGVRPVLVTFLADAGALVDVAARTGIRWLQLHAYQPPPLVRALKAAAGERRVALTVVKVLHVRGGACVERPLIGAYERAGTDVLLFDAVADDGRVGSTGRQLAGPVVDRLAGRVSRPFLLAGGISAQNRPDFAAVTGHPLFAGVDVDSAARGADGRFGRARVAAIRHHWTGAHAGAPG